MSSTEIKVGTEVNHVAIRPYRVILRTRIVRETRTQWVDAHGNHWRKSNCEEVSRYEPEPRKIEPVAA
jgi:hypothetical protein